MQISRELVIFMVIIVSLSIILNILQLMWLRKLTSHYNSLTQGIDKKSLMNVLQGIQHTIAQHERIQELTKNELQKLKESEILHIQQLILKRFNPFGDTGGDQSFILAILDGNKDGVVITSLHSRENTRFYVKSVEGGMGIDHPLSVEEQKIINRERPNKL
ncbi:hypothetical protein COT87_01230 [Candidatus Collierbacteria bacterium CG10_big_fil_rev_8_21_14_0_10_44_9]|uniref:DUF4446 domain-containing protein n=1 Tax=Candidatus Collierbacteria bacterium CG10_big_fil_rev_8_21_14_0_10_44_9 TaxID=1974535 RepID=A0A2H0VJ18_9BACT|nr:MAG: hypothetical protein COT87_01230 [Candidatus Collierbacteria bacterium CG10_big_fil_rev_8_21_14_0_10_44_9]